MGSELGSGSGSVWGQNPEPRTVKVLIGFISELTALASGWVFAEGFFLSGETPRSRTPWGHKVRGWQRSFLMAMAVEGCGVG